MKSAVAVDGEKINLHKSGLRITFLFNFILVHIARFYPAEDLDNLMYAITLNLYKNLLQKSYGSLERFLYVLLIHSF